MSAYIPYSVITLLLILGLIVLAPLLSWKEKECNGLIKLLLLSTPMLLLFLLGITVLLRFVGPFHFSAKGNLIGLTFLLKNVSGPYPTNLQQLLYHQLLISYLS